MRFSIWTGLAAATILSACGPGASRSRVHAVGGNLSIEPATLDFGDVALGKELRTAVTLHNDGIAALSVDELPAGFADGAFEIKGLPASIGPGGQARVEVCYRPARTGSNARKLTLITDAPGAPTTPVDLRGHAVLGLAQLSGDTLDFGEVVVNETANQTVSLNNNDGKASTQVSIAPPAGNDPEAFRVSRQGSLPLGPEEAMQVRIDFSPTRLGAFTGQVSITPCPTCSARAVRLTGTGVIRLVDVSPPSIDFGEVKLAQHAAQPFSVKNNSKGRVTLKSIAVSGDASIAADLDGLSMPLTLAPGQTIAGKARFAPRTIGPQGAQAEIAASDGAPGLLAIQGLGIGPIIDALPRSWFVGPVALGTRRTARINLLNVGLDPHQTSPLVISSATIVSNDAGWSITAPTSQTWTVGEPGSSSAVQVSYAPAAAGASRATLRVQSNDAIHPTFEVPLSALGRDLPPCQLQVSPFATVSFGYVPLYHPSTQGFELVNAGPGDCILGDPAIGAGEPVFHWPGLVTPSGRTLPPRGRMSVRVEFTPQATKTYAGWIELYVSNAAAPALHMDLKGSGDGGCFFVTPGTVDFGAAQTGCTAPEQVAYVVNQCGQSVVVSDLQTSGAPFTLGPKAPGLPFAVAPNTSVAIPVDYRAATPGDDVGQLFVTAGTRPGTPYQVGLTAGSQSDNAVTDEFDQSTPKVDLLIVIDNSGSMDDEQAALQRNLGVLWNRIALANADFHIAITTTGMEPYTAGWTQCPGGAQGGEGGRFFPVDGSRPRILTPQTPNVKDALFANINVGLCHWDERGLEPMYTALSAPLINQSKVPGSPWPADGNAGFLRDDARLSLLIVSDTDDDDDVVNPRPVTEWVPKLDAIKHGAHDLISFAGIVPLRSCPSIEKVGLRYKDFVSVFGGHLYDICDLDQMGTMLENALGALLAPLTSFPLSTHPRDPASIEVSVNGAVVTGWSYDAVPNRVVFPVASAPAPGSHIKVRYLASCN